MLTASCHCGAIKIEMEKKPESVTECTCSICHRLGARWAYFTRRQVRVRGLDESASAYLWGDRCIEFYHCKSCGCATHYESTEKDDDSRVAVNTRMMRHEDIDGIPLRRFDGADTWEFLD
jgi:hypothetical protein